MIQLQQQQEEAPLESDPTYIALKEKLIKQKQEKESQFHIWKELILFIEADFEARQKAWEAEQAAAKDASNEQLSDYEAWKRYFLFQSIS